MSLTKRILTFGIGFFIGIIILIFILDKKDVEFNYGPNARVIDEIQSNEVQKISADVENFLSNSEIDSTAFRQIIDEAEVIFSKSNQRQKPCRDFFLESSYNQQNLAIKLELCDTLSRYYQMYKTQ